MRTWQITTKRRTHTEIIRKSMLLVFGVIFMLFCGSMTTVCASSQKAIYTVSDLQAIAQDLDGDYVLMNNIKLPSSEEWTPIGTSSTPFTGTFNGNNHKITGLKISGNEDLQGLFGVVGDGAVIKNLKVYGSVSGGTWVGGIVGKALKALIANCTNYASVTGSEGIGGVVGRIEGGDLINCQNEGTITGTSRCAGGITGDIYPSGSATNCNNLGSVTGNSLVGGISGGCTEGPIINCNNSGNVSGSSRTGAICGDNASYAGTRKNNYFLKTSSINAGYSAVGTDCTYYSVKSTKLASSVTINSTSYSTALQALNAGAASISVSGITGRKWARNSNGILRLTTGKASASSTIKVTSISISGKKQIAVGSTLKLKATVSPSNATNKKVTWSSKNKKVATISSSGKVKALRPGKVTITAKAKDGSGIKKKVTLIVVPKKQAKPTVTSTEEGKLKISWKRQSNVSGYQIQYGTKRSFKGAKSRIVGKSKTSLTLSNITNGETYYVRIRAYVKSGSKRYYGAWSARRGVTIQYQWEILT